MAVWYLDNDDEITDAVARLRGADDEHVVFVVPPGSRIATGRINFKLLAREAESRELMMAVASPDEQVRALAASAGVLTAVTPDEAEAALQRGDEPPEVSTTVEARSVTAERPASDTASGGGMLAWRSQRLRFGTVLVLIVAIVGGYVAMQVLPTAEITLTPRIAAMDPVSAVVTASTDTIEPDPANGAIPAITVSIPLTVKDAYRSSGVESVETRAAGEVRFSAPDQEFDQEIEAGTRVQTPAGTAFQTTETVTLPRSDDRPTSEVAAPIEALESGQTGNVSAEAISVVPSLESQGISVSNPEATSGGRFEETPLVLPADYDAAAVDLRNRLVGALAAYLRDPANTPAGLTVFAETAVLGPVTHQPPADEIVDTTTDEFTLGGAVRAQVLAVDETVVDDVVRALLEDAVAADMVVVDGSVSVEHGRGRVDGDRIAFTGTALGQVTPLIDADVLLAQMAGLPVSDAQAILDGLGTATVSVWPEFLGDLPTDRDRIALDVTAPSTTE